MLKEISPNPDKVRLDVPGIAAGGHLLRRGNDERIRERLPPMPFRCAFACRGEHVVLFSVAELTPMSF